MPRIPGSGRKAIRGGKETTFRGERAYTPLGRYKSGALGTAKLGRRGVYPFLFEDFGDIEL